MTAKKAIEMSELILKILIPLFIALCTFTFQAAQSEFQELKKEILALREETQSLMIRVVLLESGHKNP